MSLCFCFVFASQMFYVGMCYSKQNRYEFVLLFCVCFSDVLCWYVVCSKQNVFFLFSILNKCSSHYSFKL